jgi:DNA-binding response OmpR family regulator
MSRLRAKTEGADGPRHIRTVHGFGYTFVRPAP